MPKEPMTYSQRYAILAGRTAYADYVRKQQAIQEGKAIFQETFSPNNEYSIMVSLHEGQFATTAAELASYLEEAAAPSGPTLTAPQAPLSLCVIPSNSALTIYFVQGSDGGSPITNYSYSTDGVIFTPFSPVQTTTPLTVSGLTNGTVYTIYLKAINAVGSSPSSTAVTAAPIPSSFDPMSISGLNVWLDGQNATNVILTGSNVSAWNDSSSATNNFTASPTGIITYDQPSSINNRPALTFTTASPATSTYLTKSFNITPGTNQLSLFMVVTQTGLATGNSELFYTRNNYRYFDVFNNTNSTGLLSLNVGNDTQRNSTIDIITTPPTIAIISVLVSSTASLYLNGTITAVNAVSRGGLSLDGVLDWAISGGAFLGSVGEVITYPTALTNLQRQLIEAYLGWKWGLQDNLPSSNPWKLTPPTGLPNNPDPPTYPVATPGSGQATVSFTAPINTGGIPIVSYTVTSSPGGFTGTATSSPIIVTGLTANSSYTFTVIATNAVGDSIPSSSSSSVTILAITDVIVNTLTTSLSAYIAGNTDDWINITSTEYNNLNTNISTTTKAGISDSYLSTANASGLANDKSALVANSLTIKSPAIPANNYLYAFAIKWVTTQPGVGLCVFTNTNSGSADGFNQVGSVLPTITSAGISYFVRKSPSATNGTAGLLACFTGTKMDYSNPNFTGSAGYIGFKILQGTGLTPIPAMRYLLGTGNTPTANSSLTGNLGGYGAFCIQGLTTPTQQWA